MQIFKTIIFIMLIMGGMIILAYDENIYAFLSGLTYIGPDIYSFY